jgi:hypothetical protein
MAAEYPITSPYYSTQSTGGFLDIWNYRDIPALTDDAVLELSEKYQYRPDLLAYDLYDDVRLWWVFAIRNPGIIRDPVFDMKPGVQIYIPNINTIRKALGN